MKIISHRGYWKDQEEKNTEIAFRRSFRHNFGTETDVRDYGRKLLISHDMPNGAEVTFQEFLDIAGLGDTGKSLPLALNIKSDGLANALASALKNHHELDCFVFDMSVPDMRSYFDAGIPVFTRMSEVERYPAWLDRASGVWLDSFDDEWYEIPDIQRLLDIGKRVCIVSPELHRRPYLKLWSRIKPIAHESGLILCTDFPETAIDFFETIC